MKDWAICSLAGLVLVCTGVLPCVAAELAQELLTAPLQQASIASQQSDVRVRRTTLRQLTGHNVLTLRGTDGSATVPFGGRADELVTRIVLRLRYSHSPALLVEQSHLRVLLNDEAMDIIPFTRETASQPNEQVIELDPRFISDLNKLRFQFIGHYTTGCEDLLHSSLWAEVSGASELEITSQPITVPNDLALLPEPFFDRRDLERLQLAFIFPQDSSLEVLRAGGVTASWFGQLAGWRGARFPVSIGKLVRGHAVVFATNTQRPKFLVTQKPVMGPTLRIMSNPLDGYSKLLLVLGRDDADLRVAVEGLVRASATLSGNEAHLQAAAPAAPRSAYDAPAWVRADRPTKFGEIVTQSSELQVQGHTPDLIRVGLRVPPDLFIWRNRGVPIDLRYRHNAMATPDGAPSRLTVSVNKVLLRSLDLIPGSGESVLSRMRTAFLDASVQDEHGEASIPAFALGARSELQFAFNFPVPKNGDCRDTYVQNIGGSIDPDSTIDFSGFHHYTALPHLGYFATAGFPFTRYADLSQTIVIVPPAPDAHEIETFVTLMGRMGESTGMPVTALRLLSTGYPVQYKDADLLVIGASARLKLLDQWQTHLPSLVDGATRPLNLPPGQSISLQGILGYGGSANPAFAMQTSTDNSSEPIAAFFGFESPVTPGRSVVIVTADTSESLHVALDSLDDTGLVRAMYGDVVLMHAKKVDSYQLGKTYFVGELPVWTWLWYRTANYPLVLVTLAIIASLLFALITWRGLRRIARKRLDGAS